MQLSKRNANKSMFGKKHTAQATCQYLISVTRLQQVQAKKLNFRIFQNYFLRLMINSLLFSVRTWWWVHS